MGLIHLYPANTTVFTNNGTPLVTAMNAVVKRDEGFQLTFELPIDQNGIYKTIQKEMIVRAMTPDGMNYFRIWDMEKRTTEVVVTALQLLYTLDKKQVNSISGRRYTGTTILGAYVNAFKSSIAPYTFSSSIASLHDFYTNEENDDSTSHNALAVLNKITDVWGGELLLNGFDVRMVSKLGTKTDALLYEYKNIASFSDSSSVKGLVTRIYATSTFTPEKAEGATEDPKPVVLSTTVDSPLINQYSVIYEAYMTYNDARTIAELKAEITKQYSEQNVDKPERTIDVETNIIDGTVINFGDELVLKYLIHDVDEVIRCVGYEYDPISENYIGVTLGTLEKTFLTKVTEGISNIAAREFDKLNKKIQVVQASANGKNRVTYGPLSVPNPIEGDLWFYHPEGRPDEIELLIYQNGQWLPAPFLTDQDKTQFEQDLVDYQNDVLAEIALKDQEYKEVFEGYDGKVVVMDQEISDAATKAQSALEEAGISTDLAQTAKDIAAIAQSNAAIAQSNANQAKADASTAQSNANQAQADADTAVTNANQAKVDASTAVTNANQAKVDAQTAITNASTAVTEAGKAKVDAQTAITNASTAVTEASQAKADASTAKTNAQTAMTNAGTAVTNASTAVTEANQAKADASTAKTNAQTALTNAGTAITNASTAITEASQAKADASTAKTNAQTAITNASQAKADASTAKTNAQTALDNAQSALTTAGSADSKAGQAIAKADAIPTTITNIIADKNLVNGNYVDTKVNAATGAWSQELVRVEGVIDGLEIGDRNIVLNGDKVLSGTAYSMGKYELSESALTLEPGDEVVWTVKAELGDNVSHLSFYNTDGIGGVQRSLSRALFDEHGVAQFKTTWLGTKNLYFLTYKFPQSNTENTIINWVKVVAGNKSSRYFTPAPEDLYSQEEFKLFNAKYTQDVTGITGRLTTVETNKLDGATFQTFKQAEYQVTADKVASTITRVDTAEGKITTQGTAITQQAGLIENKAEKTVVDSLSGTVSNQGTLITQNATDIESKASQTEVDTVKGTVSTHTTTIGQHATAISSKADKTVVDTLSGTVTNQGTSISQNATDIASKANTSTVNTLTGRVDTAESNISQNATAITQRVTTTTYNTGIGSKENTVLKQSTAPTHLNGRLWLDTSVTPNVLKRSNGTTWIKATPTTPGEVGAYSQSDGAGLAGRLTTAETNITQTATAITSKADKSVVDTLAGTVSTQGTTITQQATSIASKANQTEVDTVKGTVSGHTTTISQHATAIASKAESSLVNTIKGTVDAHTTEISQNATDIASKASSTSVNTLTGRVSTAESNISQNATAITQRVTTTTYNAGIGSKEDTVLKQSTAPAHVNGRLWLDTSVTPNILNRSTGTAWVKATPTTASEVGAYSSGQGSTLAGRVTTAETNITQTSTAITSKADKSVVDTLSGTVSTHTTTLSQQATAISSKAEQTEVNTVKGTVSGHTTTLSQHATAIASKAESSLVNTIKGTVDTHTTEISQNATAIASKASSTSVSTLTGRVSTAETTIGQHATAITSKASQTEVDAVKGTVSSHTTTLSQHATDISARLTSAQVNSLVDGKGLAKTTYVDTQINASATGIRADMTRVEGKIDGLEIGGRNLILNSYLLGMTGSDNGNRDVTTFDGEVSIITPINNGNIYAYPQPSIELVNGHEYTLSFDILTNTALSVYWYANTGGGAGSGGSIPNTKGEWIKYTFTYTQTRDSFKGSFLFGFSGLIAGSEVKYKNLKLEKGNVATGWTPAPEDTMMENDFNIFKASYEATAEALTSRLTAVDKVGGRLATAETSITQNATAIASKASQTEVNTVKGTVSGHTTTLSQHATAISSKAESSLVNTIKGTVDTHTTSISQNATAIASKASSSSVSTLTGRVSTAETTITQHATSIASKASQTEVDTVKGTVSSHTTTLSQHATQIGARLTSTEVNSLVDGKGLAKTTYVDTQITAKAGEITTSLTTLINGKANTSAISDMATKTWSNTQIVAKAGEITTSITNLINNTPSQGDNLIINGGFEQYVSGNVSGGDPVGWSGVTELHAAPHSGSRALILRATSGTNMVSHTSLIPVTPGRIYEYGYWIQSSTDANGVAGNSKMRIGKPDGTHVHDTGVTGPVSTSGNPWIFKSGIFTAPADTFDVVVAIFYNHTIGWYKYDDLYLRDISDLEAAKSYANTQIDVKAGQITTSLTTLINGKANASAISDMATKTWSNTQIEAKAGTITTSLTTLINGKVSQAQVNASILADKKVEDTRSTNQTPAWYYTNKPQQKVLEFKTATVVGIVQDSTTYVLLETDVPWSGSSGGYVTQTATSSTTKWTRRGNSTTWTAWVEEADVTYVNTKITQSATGIETLISQVKTNPTGTITGYNSLKQNVDSMVQAIGTDGGKIAQIVMTDSVYQTSIRKGGRNLLKNAYGRIANPNRLHSSFGVKDPIPNGTRVTLSFRASSGTNQIAQIFNSNSYYLYGNVTLTGGQTERVYHISFTWNTNQNGGSAIDINNQTLHIYNKLEPNATAYIIVQWAVLQYGEIGTEHYISDDEDTQTKVTQLADSYAMTITSRDVIKTQLNLTTGGVKIKGDLIHLSGTSLIDNAVIKSAMIDTLNVSKLYGTTAEFTALRANVITAGSISADRLVVGTALVDRVFASDATIAQLTSKSAFINNIKAISIDVGKITGNIGNFVTLALKAANSNVTLDGSMFNLGNLAGDFVQMNSIPEVRSQDAEGTAVIMGKGRYHVYSDNIARFYLGSTLENRQYHGVHVAKGQTFGIYRYSDTYGGTPAQYHKVVSGESWRSITDKYFGTSASVAVLMTLNGYTTTNYRVLQPGDMIIIKAAVAGNSSGIEQLWTMGTSTAGVTRLYSHPEHVFAYRIEVQDRARFIKQAVFEASFLNNSDRRIKHDIKDTEVTALDHLDSLTFKEYKLNSNGSKVPLGLIAQDSGILRVKGADEGDYEGVDGLLMPMLAMKGVQELHAIVKEQAEKIKQLEEIINQ